MYYIYWLLDHAVCSYLLQVWITAVSGFVMPIDCQSLLYCATAPLSLHCRLWQAVCYGGAGLWAHLWNHVGCRGLPRCSTARQKVHHSVFVVQGTAFKAGWISAQFIVILTLLSFPFLLFCYSTYKYVQVRTSTYKYVQVRTSTYKWALFCHKEKLGEIKKVKEQFIISDIRNFCTHRDIRLVFCLSSRLTSTCFFHLRRLRRLGCILDIDAWKRLVCTLIHIDYCNSALAGLPDSTWRRYDDYCTPPHGSS